MSRHLAFRRQPVEQPYAQNLRTTTLPAPTRGIIQSENETYMQPGGCNICDNWAPTMRGVKLRGGSIRHCDLHALDNPAWAINQAYTTTTKAFDSIEGSTWQVAVNHTSAQPAWVNNTSYAIGALARDTTDTTFWKATFAHTSPAAGTFAADRTARGYWMPATFKDERAAHPTYWTSSPITRLPVISAFEYMFGNTQRMFAAQATKLFDVTNALPVLVKAGQTSGNYAAAQLANAAVSALGTNWLIAVNDTGDYPLRYNGTSWVTVDGTGAAPAPTDGASKITGPTGTPVEFGRALGYVWKYRNRLFFVEVNSMNAWYLGIDAVGGTLLKVPLAGSAGRGGKLLFGASWSMDAGDGLSEKCIFGTDQGEILIFEGTNPGDAANWKQQGRYYISPPLGMNAHIQVGGDMLILTVDGIVPLSQAITKSAGQLELAMLTRNIKKLWRDEVTEKRAWSWTPKKWDEYGAMFVTTPGGVEGERNCLLVNSATTAWGRFVGWDATCWIRMRADMFFGTQHGVIMQAERTGKDDLWDERDKLFRQQPYIATLVGGWEMFGASANTIVWHQARATFKSGNADPFQPQLAATVNYNIVIPPPPAIGVDPGVQDVWDQGIWYPTTADPPGGATPPPADVAAYLQWDQSAILVIPIRNTLWVSIGQTGYAHAPIVQVTISQQATPVVELISISATYEPAGVNV